MLYNIWYRRDGGKTSLKHTKSDTIKNGIPLTTSHTINSNPEKPSTWWVG